MAQSEGARSSIGIIAGVAAVFCLVLGICLYAFAAHGFWAGFGTTLILFGALMVFGAGQSVPEAVVGAVFLAILLGLAVPKARSIFSSPPPRPGGGVSK